MAAWGQWMQDHAADKVQAESGDQAMSLVKHSRIFGTYVWEKASMQRVSAASIGIPLLSIALLIPAANAPAIGVGNAPPSHSGVDLLALDGNVRPQDDFYQFAVGGWIREAKAPPYLAGWSAGRELQFDVYRALDKDLVQLSSAKDIEPEVRKLVDLRASYMDTAGIDAAGLRPLAQYLQKIDEISSPDGIWDALAMLSAHGIDIGIGTWVHADDEDPTRYIADFVQSDLGLSRRDQYISSEPRDASVRDAYRKHVERVLALSGATDAAKLSMAILELETGLAKAQWTEVATRVPGATSHRVSRTELVAAASGLGLTRFADGIGIPPGTTRYNISEPDYFDTFGRMVTDVPPPVWRAYLRYRLLDNLARFLPSAYRDEADAFWTVEIGNGAAARPRWLRAMGVLEDSMGDALGTLYVRRHFPADAKVKATRVLDNVVASFRRRIQTSAWMDAASKRGALDKLDKLVIRMGAPDHVRNYSTLQISATDAAGNWMRARALRARVELDKLGRQVDREEWTMSPQSVNGYYSASKNQVVLPAALLQPPYFQANADDAVNYGGLGFFIAHELSHAFDRAGSQYDGAGKRVEWMTAPDRLEFERRAHALIERYSRYEIAHGVSLDGELTIGENIADNAGLAIAHDAFHRSRGKEHARVLDGFSDDQRFYLGYARTWATQADSSPAAIAQARADTHAPPHLRVNGAVASQDAFQTAFDVPAGSRMYLQPSERTDIW